MLFSIHISEKPADSGPNYGHERIEDISSMLEGLFIVAVAIMIAYAAIGGLFEPLRLLDLNLAIGISMIATGLNAALSWLLSHTPRKTGSAALEGDAKHLFSDVLSSVGVWLGLFLAELTGWSALDSILAFGVAALIAKMGAGLVDEVFSYPYGSLVLRRRKKDKRSNRAPQVSFYRFP